MARAEGKRFPWRPVSDITTTALEVFAFRDAQVVEITCPEFSAVCPFSGLPDIATVRIRYIPRGRALELKSLKYYLTSFRPVGIYQEAVTRRIRRDLARVLRTRVEVSTVYNTRGGIDVTCVSPRREL